MQENSNPSLSLSFFNPSQSSRFTYAQAYSLSQITALMNQASKSCPEKKDFNQSLVKMAAANKWH